MIIENVNLLNAAVNYVDPLQGGEAANLLMDVLQAENESYTSQTMKESIAAHPLASKLSSRNFKDAYIVPVGDTKVLLNLLPSKQFVTDGDVSYVIDTAFDFFAREDPREQLDFPYTLLDGSFFRVTGGGVLPADEYQYYMVDNGIVRLIPNIKTLQVLLAERNKPYSSIIVVEPDQFKDLLRESRKSELMAAGMKREEAEIQAANELEEEEAAGGGGGGGGGAPIEDKEDEWTIEMEDVSYLEKYAELAATAASAEALAAATTAAAQTNFDVMQSEIEQEQAAAEAAEAEAQAAEQEAAAAEAASEAAQAEASAAEAEAEAAREEAELERDNLELEREELELQAEEIERLNDKIDDLEDLISELQDFHTNLNDTLLNSGIDPVPQNNGSINS